MASFAGYDIADPDTSTTDATPAPANGAPQSFGGYDIAPDAPSFSVTEDSSATPRGKRQPRSQARVVSGEEVAPMSSGGVSANNVVRSLSSGVPLIGPLMNRADAATNALLAPVLNQFFAPEDQLKGDTFADRYNRSLAIQNGLDKSYSFLHPALNTAGNTVGAVASTLPAIAAAPVAFGASEGPLLGRTLLSSLTGGGVNAADTALRGGSLPEIGRSGVLGTILGGVAPAAGDIAGSALSGGGRLAVGASPGAANIANIARESGIVPIQMEARLAQLGPYGTLADVAPAFQNEAGGLASMGGFPTQALKSVMEARAAGKDTRVSDAVAQTIGPRPDLTATRKGIENDASQAAGPYYKAAQANPTPVDATPVVSYIDNALETAKGGVAKTLQMARNLVTKDSPLPGVTVPEDNAQSLLGARQALDDFIGRAGDADTTAGKNAIRQASAVRDQIDAIVKKDPNIKAGDAAFSTKISERDALDEGADLFKPGTRIEDVNRSIAAKTPEQIGAMQKGALSALHDRLDGVSGDWGAARQMFGKSDANRQKLDALFPGAQDLFDHIEAELSMRQTEQNVAAGSQTAARRAIQEKYAPGTKTGTSGILPAITGAAAAGAPGAVATQAVGSAINSVKTAARTRLINETASALATPQTQISPLMDQVTRAFYAQPTISALSNGGNALTNATVRNQVPSVPKWVLPNGGISALLSTAGIK